jgi:haloacetate dehalogenase
MDTADFEASRRVTCPTLLLWGARGGVGRNHKPAEVWAHYATDIVRATSVPSGHYLQEECPDETYAELRAFFRT